MCKKHAKIQLIYGKNGSGKSKLIRNLMNKQGSYLFSFEDNFSKGFVNQEAVEDMYHTLRGKKLNPQIPMSFSEKVILQFCYELQSILEMEVPFKRLFIDGFPCSLDNDILSNFLALFEQLSHDNFKLTLTTCDSAVKDNTLNFFGDDPNFKLVEL